MARARRVVKGAHGDLTLSGPEAGRPATASLLRAFVSGRRSTPMVEPDGITPLNVLGIDERQRRTDTAQPPLRMICSIEVGFGGGTPEPAGTGWLVGRRTVVTAAHVLWWDLGKADRVRVIPGRDRTRMPQGAFDSTRFHFHPAWGGSSAGAPENDIAAICLPEAIGDRIGWFGVAALSDRTLAGRNVNIAGYPAAVAGQQVERCTELWHEINRIDRLAPARIFYDVDTSEGQSGAPALLWPDPSRPEAAPLAIGVHARGTSATDAVNSATRINADKLGLLGGWVAEDNHG